MTSLIKAIITVVLLTSVLGCQAKLNDYKDTNPVLRFEEYFNGPITAWGLVQDYKGEVTRRFCVEMVGTWQQNKGLLAETFYFDDGEVSYRNWQLTKQENSQYTGKAEDVIGQAKGATQGFAGQWRYTLSLDIDDSIYHFTLDDWLYQIDEHRAFNRAKMKKFGIEVAELTLFFDKQTPLRSCTKKDA